jgi:hypothetical protein
MKSRGLVAYEDYIAWGAVEREKDKWDWSQHDKTCELVHQAGLKYVVYDWIHFPPTWVSGDPNSRTLMKCLEHGETTNYLSIFDGRTIGYYDRFYQSLAAHFGDKIDGVYACILGPYGEGNYPIQQPDWINMGHCHAGYWCGDDNAIAAFRGAMIGRYQNNIELINQAWQTTYGSFDEVQPPAEIKTGDISPDAFPRPGDRQRWLDFVTWYHQSLIGFADASVLTALKYFPKEKLRIKPGGNAGGVNPIAWGTYCPGFAKQLARHGIYLQPADCHGAVFGDKWIATAYQFYNVPLSTEPAGDLDDAHFLRRMFSDASCGASQIFTYQFDRHAEAIQKYVHLFTGKPGETEIAVYCPTTLWRLGGDLKKTIDASDQLRDLCDFDVLDELLINDGALSFPRYKALILFQGDFVDQGVLDRISGFVGAGGKLFIATENIRNVAGAAWPLASSRPANVTLLSRDWLTDLVAPLKDLKGCDGILDGVWTTHRDGQIFVFNTTNKPVAVTLMNGGRPRMGVHLRPHELFSTK